MSENVENINNDNNNNNNNNMINSFNNNNHYNNNNTDNNDDNNNNNNNIELIQIEDDIVEQLKLKKLQLKRKLEQLDNKNNSDNDNYHYNSIDNNSINNSSINNENQEIKTIKLNKEEEFNQVLKETFIDFNDSSLKLVCNGPLLSNCESKLESFYKSIKWSPDGTCLLTCSEDKYIRLFEFPFNSLNINNNQDNNNNNINQDSSNNNIDNLKPVIEFKEFETIYDYCWYPHMNSNNPISCCFLTSSKEYPINLYDAFTGKKRCSYKPYKDVDDLESAYSIQFNNDGSKVYSGFKKSIKIFNIDRPGDDYDEIITTSKRNSKRKNRDEALYLNGIISSIAFDKMSMSGFFAASTYSGNIGLFDERIDQLVDILPNAAFPNDINNNSSQYKMGITQIMFSPKDSNYLFASYRKSNYIIGWDIRNSVAQQVYQLYRPLNSHQRIQFDIDPITSRYLSSGSQNGTLYIYDLFNNGNLVYSKDISNNNNQKDSICLNSTSFHPYLPLLSTSFGERQFHLNNSNQQSPSPSPSPSQSQSQSQLQLQSQSQHVQNIQQKYNNSFSIFKYN